jgi:hypothetical protein
MNKIWTQRVFFLCLLLFLAMSCSFVGSSSEATPSPTPGAQAVVTVAPGPSALAVNTPTPTAEPLVSVPSPTDAGSFSDFLSFAAEIDQAIRGKDASFFADRASPSSWDCLGDETQGICLGRASGQHLEGIPVTDEWKTYKLYSLADYQRLWQSAFKRVPTPRLVAVANQFGDNPLMPAADQSFQAIVSAAKPGAETSRVPVRVLYFEYSDDSWRLLGELVTSDHAGDWLQGNCTGCYDTWSAWPK